MPTFIKSTVIVSSYLRLFLNSHNLIISRRMSSIPIFVAEAFTKGANEAYTGNPAGVIFLEYDNDISDETKQKIASTIYLPTTAFVAAKGWTRSDANKDSSDKVLNRTIRWFTPTHEIQLCGHATFAAAKVLSTVFREVEKVYLESKFHGTLIANIERNNKEEDAFICLDFPESPTVEISPDTPWLPILTRLFLEPQESFEYVGFSKNALFLMLVLKRKDGEESLATLNKIHPNFQELLQADVGGLALDGFSVTIQGHPDVGDSKKPNCYSRQFSPHIGINEDHVCGSMHTMVIPYWTKVLNLHGQFVTAHQASQRGGDLQCLVIDGRVKLRGRGRVVSEGKLKL